MRGCLALLALITMSSGLWAAEQNSLAEPNWPLGYAVPEKLGGKSSSEAKAELLLAIPEGAKQIRAVMIVPNNTDSKNLAEHPPLREVAKKHGMAILYLRHYNTGIESEKPGDQPDTTKMPALLDWLAEQTGIVEFRHAPWITFGKSSRAKFPFRMAWIWPDRTIATIDYHGETPTWPPADFAKLTGQSIFALNANGESEWGGTWFIHVRPSLLNYGAEKGWLAHQIVARGVGHGDYYDGHGNPTNNQPVPPGVVSRFSIWDYIALFIDKALTYRLPKDEYPTKGPIKLIQVDEQNGYVIDPFAVEETFGVPHLPLKEEGGVYVVGGGGDDSPVHGFAAFSPLKDFVPGEGAPLVKYESGQSPCQWLITDSLKFAMQADPMLHLGDLQKLMPKAGDEVTIDGKPLTFKPIIPKYAAPKGGIALNTGLHPGRFDAKITLLAYTVLEFAQKQQVKVQAGYTAATRVQLVINGVPVKHKQVLEMQPGKYPLLLVLRMAAKWDRIEPSLVDATEADVALAKTQQAEAEARAASLAKMKAAGPQAPKALIRKASEVPAEERKKMLWIADKELADAWLRVHTVK